MSQTLLIEIGTEELPPKALLRLSTAFLQSIENSLSAAGISAGTATAYATPRRLAVSIAEVAEAAPDQQIEKLGPNVDKAFDAHGEPTPAANGFARSCGVSVEALEQRETDKGKRLAFSGTAAGQMLAQLLPTMVAEALKALPIPKRMRWGDLSEAFVRPVHSITALHGNQVIPLSLFACAAGRYVQGHRFHCNEALELSDADSYAELLRSPGYVIASFEERRDIVRKQVLEAAQAKGGQALIDPDLLDEVTSLVEWPVALAGDFSQDFLQLPSEVLIATLQGHQRYFPVENPDGSLRACFVTVANIQSKDTAQIIAGNERVVKPRLSDALFFWQTDIRRGLDSYARELTQVSFERQLGSVADKSRRVARLAAILAENLNIPNEPVIRACTLAKADLLTEMVGEFPELQGTMGRYYASGEGENEAVAWALEEQYAPRHSGAPIPASDTGRVLALADKLDTLAGIFAVGKRPSGDKDPFALRRAALGLLRILIEAEIALDLDKMLDIAVSYQPVDSDRSAVVTDLKHFLLERLRGYLFEQGIEPGVFESVAGLKLSSPLDFQRRVLALRTFLSKPEAQQLSAAHKRVRNILKKERSVPELKENLLTEPAEIALFTALKQSQKNVKTHLRAFAYGAALYELAQLQETVAAFFDQVLVMSEDAAVRANRLALLVSLDLLCRQVADLSKLSIE